MQITINLEDALVARVKYFAEGLKIPIDIVVQNWLIDIWAKAAAKVDLGGPNNTVFPCFTLDGDRTLTGGELFDYLKAFYRGELQQPAQNRELEESRLANLKKYRKEGELVVSIEELARRKRDEKIAELSPEIQEKVRKAEERNREMRKQKPQ